ncbi:hypothetical protein [Streptomyces sp. BRA346]|uniref:hypothetical protein n=1 Tax=Streptomyces sp. BRA346 TaxID=2878199 RepID=UPI00406402A8
MGRTVAGVDALGNAVREQPSGSRSSGTAHSQGSPRRPTARSWARPAATSTPSSATPPTAASANARASPAP